MLTNQQAINILKEKINQYTDNSKTVQAIDIAIKAIENQNNYIRGLEDAWDIARRFVSDKYEHKNAFSENDMSVIFNEVSGENIIKNVSILRVMDLLKDFELLNSIKIGDVVTTTINGCQIDFVVVGSSNDMCWGVAQDGRICHVKDVKKTGSFVDIASVLNQIADNVGV